MVRKEYADIVKQFPWLSNIHILDTKKGRNEVVKINEELKHIHYDHILDLHKNIRSVQLRKGLSGKLHAVNKRTLRRWLLVRKKINLLRIAPDIIGRYFETVKELDIKDTGLGATFGKTFIQSHIKKAAICPGSKHWNKRWPEEYFQELAKDLIEKGYQIEFFGSENEQDLVRSIAKTLPQDKVTDLCGKLTLAELPERIAECSFAITNDSGLMHVATATGIPTYAIFGPTVREFGFMPRSKNATVIENTGLDCRPCTTIGLEHCPKGHFKCMKEITPNVVFESILL